MEVGNVQNFSTTNMTAYQPRFKGSKKVSEVKEIHKGDYIEKRVKTEGTTGKKWFVGLASTCFPGLGQFINGDVAKGLAFLGTYIAANAGILIGHNKKSNAIAVGSFIGGLATTFASAIDAVRNAKSEATQIVKK